jgi:tetratricopeptide (TPR) repeat protein
MTARALAISLLAAVASSVPAADAHMHAGARYFQADRFDEALVEFRVAEELGDPSASWYSAATLVKLHRPAEAVPEFSRAERVASADRDALLDYYHALACYEARLYACAERLLAEINQQAGPRIAAQAEQLRASLRPVLAGPAPPATLDWYHARARDALAAKRWELAAAYFEEALALGRRRGDNYRGAEAAAGLADCRPRLPLAGRRASKP